MAESVKEVVPETRPRGQRRGLDRLRASGEGPASAAASAAAATEVVPARTIEQQAVPVADTVADPPAAVADPLAAEAPPQQTGTTTRTPGRIPSGRNGLVSVAVIALLALLVAFLGYRLWHTHSAAQADKRHYDQLTAVDGRNQAVQSAARQEAVTLLTYDYHHLDADFAAVLNGSTGGFKKDFANRATTAKSLFVQGKAVASGQVLDAAVASSTANTATVLVVIDQSVKNVSVPSGTTKHYRMQLKLNRVGSSWLVSDVEFPA